jgi:hypothetical protein
MKKIPTSGWVCERALPPRHPPAPLPSLRSRLARPDYM